MDREPERARAERYADGQRRRRQKHEASAEAAADRLLQNSQADLPEDVADLPAFSTSELDERVRDNREVQAAYVTRERRRQWREQPADSTRRTADTGIGRAKAAELRRQYVANVPDLTPEQRTVLMLRGQEISDGLLADLRGFPEILTACRSERWDEFETRVRDAVGRGGRVTEKGIAALLGVSQPAVAQLHRRGFARVLAFARQRDLAALQAEAEEEWNTRSRAEWDEFRARERLDADEDPYEWGYGVKAILESLIEDRQYDAERDWGSHDVDDGTIEGFLEDLGHRSGNTDSVD